MAELYQTQAYIMLDLEIGEVILQLQKKDNFFSCLKEFK